MVFHRMIAYLDTMKMLQKLLFPILLVGCAVVADETTYQGSPHNHYAPVPYSQAPSYYPGSPWHFPPGHSRPDVCHVHSPGNGGDAAPYIIQAFKRCGRNGKVIFDNTTYNVNTVMNITGLSNVEVDVRGTLVWSTDIDYWLNNSIPIGFQNQSSAFFFGGDEVWWHGNGYGTFNGNGQIWYDFAGHESNYPGRPHAITWWGLNNSVVEGMRFEQSQMWTMTLMYSHNVLLQDIYVNSTYLDGELGEELRLNQNTDGADTLYSDNITFVRWVIQNGDDSISQKTNSTNILIEDCSFYRGIGVALGSIGQYAGQYDQIVNVTARNIQTFDGTWFAGYVKIWSGTPNGYPPNGGGGGTGRIHNITFTNFTLGGAQQMFQISSCLGQWGSGPGCDSSNFSVSDIKLSGIEGSLTTEDVVSLQCSSKAPCPGIELENIRLSVNGTTPAYLCSNVSQPIGFDCTGLTPQV